MIKTFAATLIAAVTVQAQEYRSSSYSAGPAYSSSYSSSYQAPSTSYNNYDSSSSYARDSSYAPSSGYGYGSSAPSSSYGSSSGYGSSAPSSSYGSSSSYQSKPVASTYGRSRASYQTNHYANAPQYGSGYRSSYRPTGSYGSFNGGAAYGYTNQYQIQRQHYRPSVRPSPYAVYGDTPAAFYNAQRRPYVNAIRRTYDPKDVQQYTGQHYVVRKPYWETPDLPYARGYYTDDVSEIYQHPLLYGASWYGMNYDQYMRNVEQDVDYEAFDYDNWVAPKYWQYNGQDEYYKNNQLIKDYNVGENYNELYNKSPYANQVQRAYDPYRQFHYLQDPYYYDTNAYNSYSYNPARNIFGHFTDYEDGFERSYRGNQIDYGYQTPPDYETPPQQPYEAEVFHDVEEEVDEAEVDAAADEYAEADAPADEYAEAEAPADEYTALDEYAAPEVDNTERDYFVEMLISYGYGQAEILDIMAQEGYDMTDYTFAATEAPADTYAAEPEDERVFYCEKLAEYGYSQAEIVVIMESEGYDMSDYVFPTY